MAEEKDTRPCDDMSESRIKSGRKQRFTVLYKSAIEDKRLPLDARGLLAIMVGLPDGWQYSVKGLAAYVGVSKDTIRRLLISTHAPLAGRDSKSVQITMHIFAITDKFQMLLHRMPPVRAFCSFLMQENHADFGCEPPK